MFFRAGVRFSARQRQVLRRDREIPSAPHFPQRSKKKRICGIYAIQIKLKGKKKRYNRVSSSPLRRIMSGFKICFRAAGNTLDLICTSTYLYRERVSRDKGKLHRDILLASFGRTTSHTAAIFL